MQNSPSQNPRKIGYEDIAVYGEKSYNGVAILSRLPLDDIVHGFPGDGDGHRKCVIAATVEGVHVVNAYFPHGTLIGSDKFHSKIDWVNRLRKYFDQYYSPDDEVLLCGDTNITPHEIDLWNVRHWAKRMHFTKEECEVFSAP